MHSNPFLGVVLHWLGGLAAGSYYVLFYRVKKWSWEVFWLTGGLVAWVIMPWTMAFLLTDDLLGVLSRTPGHTLLMCYTFGALWGLGVLTAGLAIRFLGMSLGQGVTLGFCAAFGSLLPPFLKGQLPAIIASSSGKVTLAGVGVSLLGIAVASLAGLCKEREMPEEEKKKAIAEFSFSKGIVVATFAGVMSGFFAFGLDAGAPITDLSAAAGTPAVFAGLPRLIAVYAGGFSVNLVCCLYLAVRKRTAYQYVGFLLPREPGSQLPTNYLFCLLAGITSYIQFLFYTMGESMMGHYKFSSWTLHMASIIIFSTMWGWILHEWKGSSRRTLALIAIGLTVLVLSTLVVGYGNYLGMTPP